MDIFSFEDRLFLAAVGLSVGIGVSLYALRKWFDGGRCTSTALLDGKTVLITGGNSGIGKATAIDLAKRGARVVITCRDPNVGLLAKVAIKVASGNLNIEMMQLDLSSFESVRKFATEFLECEERLDILINNAGVMWCPYSTTEDGLEMQIGVNHFGPFLLTNLLLDQLKKCSPSRIVIVSSMVHFQGKINFDDINSEKSYSAVAAYSQSKLANNLFCFELARRLEGTGVTAYCLHPGAVETNLTRHSLTKTNFRRILLRPFYWLMWKSPEQGAQTSIYCAVQEGIEKYSGKYFSDCQLKNSPKSGDEGVATKLWELSERTVGLQ